MRTLFRDALKGLLTPVGARPALPAERLVFGDAAPLAWKAVSDKAFGGSSQGGFDAASKTFRGTVAQEGGFVAIRAPLKPEAGDIDGFAGLAARVRSDGNKYTLSCKPLSSFKDDFQSYLVIQSREWVEVEVNFLDMVLTGAGGQVREAQRALDGGTVSSLIISCGGINAPKGDFRLEIDWIKWIQKTKRTPEPAIFSETFDGDDSEGDDRK